MPKKWNYCNIKSWTFSCLNPVKLWTDISPSYGYILIMTVLLSDVIICPLQRSALTVHASAYDILYLTKYSATNLAQRYPQVLWNVFKPVVWSRQSPRSCRCLHATTMVMIKYSELFKKIINRYRSINKTFYCYSSDLFWPVATVHTKMFRKLLQTRHVTIRDVFPFGSTRSVFFPVQTLLCYPRYNLFSRKLGEEKSQKLSKY